jgi:hypothetical protein
MMQSLFEAELIECRWLGGRSKREAGYLSAKRQKPFCQPRALEPCMACEENPFAAINITECHSRIRMSRSPNLPRRFPLVPNLVQVLGFLVSVHRLPEALMLISV